MEDDGPGLLGLLDPFDRGAGIARARIVAGCEDDRDCSILGCRQLGVAKIAACCRPQVWKQVALEARQQRLRLRVAEAAVELEHPWALVRQHQAGKERPDEWRPAPGELVEYWTMDGVDDFLDLRRPQGRDGRVGAHSAGVRPCVPLADALEVLRRRQGHRPRTVAEGEHGHLLAFEQLLDHEGAAEADRGPQAGVHVVRRPTDEHALAGGEAVGLDHARRPGHRERLRRRDARRRHHVLCEPLRPLDPGRGGARAEDCDSGVPELVGDPGNQRPLRAHDHEVGVDRARQRQEALAVLRADGMASAESGDPRVPGCGVQLVERRRLAELPGERMLASARAHQQHLHRGEPTATIGGFERRPRRRSGATIEPRTHSLEERFAGASTASAGRRRGASRFRRRIDTHARGLLR
jgi:hypothetical protein